MTELATAKQVRLLLSLEISDRLERLAAARGETVSSLASKVLGNGLYVLETTQKGNRLLEEDPHGTRRPLTPA